MKLRLTHKLHLFPVKSVIPVGTEDDIKQVQELTEAKKAVIYVAPEECQDYFYDRTTGKLIYPIKSISINLMPFHLHPGKNEVPYHVKEFYEQMKDGAHDGKRKNMNIAKPRNIIMGNLF